ncbi:unnamed protein product [Durusdinium trenchii]|uniref:tRNA/rRNA methyltransferase SpoU type domain-containing protein n=1 Tax=Durusdinium trenchii TaxID=1381693 RepID=A0ABP0QKN4_9DINO
MEAKEVLSHLQRAGYRLVGLTAHDNGTDIKALWDVPLAAPGLALIFGREHDGIPADAEALLDEAVTIPMAVSGEEGSLNVSHAAAVVLYERWEQLQRHHGNAQKNSRARGRAGGH